MKVLCPACERLCDFEKFRVDGAALFITCARCGVEQLATAVSDSAQLPEPAPNAALAVQAEVPPPMSSSPSSPPIRPLSLVSSPSASNIVVLRTASTESVEHAAAAAQKGPFAAPSDCCPKCMAKRLEGTTSCPGCGLVFALLDPTVLEPPRWLAEGWKELLASWGNDQRHEQLRKRASQGDALAALGRLYRMRLAWMPEDPWAQRGRDEVVRLAATTGLQRFNGGDGQQPKAEKYKLFAVLVLLVLVGLGFVGFIRVFLSARAGL